MTPDDFDCLLDTASFVGSDSPTASGPVYDHRCAKGPELVADRVEHDATGFEIVTALQAIGAQIDAARALERPSE